MTIQDVLDEMIKRPGTPAEMLEAIGIPVEEWVTFAEKIWDAYPKDEAFAYLTSFCLIAGEMHGLRRKIN